MNYQESLQYLDSLGQFGIRLGMDRIQQLLFVLGHPENQIKTVHVAGTNGKGSVTTMISTILMEAGLLKGPEGRIYGATCAAFEGKADLNATEIMRRLNQEAQDYTP